MRKDLGVSSVIFVILMTASIVAIGATVYVYTVDNDLFSGQVIEKFRTDSGEHIYYWFTIENTTLDRIKDIEITQDVYHLYDVGNYYNIKDIRR